MRHRSLVSQPLRQSLAGLLVFALLLTQALGLLHRVHHAGGPSNSLAEHSHGVLEVLFTQHHDEGDCQIYDQLAHADGVGFDFVEPGALPPAPLPAMALPLPMLAAQAAGYLARGPPGTA
jgi:hypothetical protein